MQLPNFVPGFMQNISPINRNRNIIIGIGLFVFTALVSCEKEKITEISPTTPTRVLTCSDFESSINTIDISTRIFNTDDGTQTGELKGLVRVCENIKTMEITLISLALNSGCGDSPNTGCVNITDKDGNQLDLRDKEIHTMSFDPTQLNEYLTFIVTIDKGESVDSRLRGLYTEITIVGYDLNGCQIGETTIGQALR